METAPLIKMLNNIGAFYETMPDRPKAIADMAKHIRSFWDPRMRRTMTEYLQQYPDGQSTEGELNEFSRSAFNYLQENLK